MQRAFNSTDDFTIALAEISLGRNQPWPKSALAEISLGRNQPWPKSALAEISLGRNRRARTSVNFLERSEARHRICRNKAMHSVQ
jgi:hypothetical protein